MTTVGPTILIVEDDHDIRETLKELLEDNGYHVGCAANGLQALAALRAGPLPNAILLDLTMPIMDGYAFRAAQLADPRIAGVPVVVMTADGRIEEKRRRLGCEHALTKPMTVQELLATLAAYS